MSQISKAIFLKKTIFPKAIFGALAISVACGAVQLAFGHDLAGSHAVASFAAPEAAINRIAKADRAAVRVAPAPMRTVSLRFNGLPDTSVLVRVPATKAETRNRPAPSLLKSGNRKNAVACEPVVSVLTEVAKLLQPGRCVT